VSELNGTASAGAHISRAPLPSGRAYAPPGGGRGVLEGAFELLEVLARTPAGAGLSELARDAGLPKATTHRLLEQLTGLGAVQRDGQRYSVGSALARIGRSWQPHPALRRASLAPTHTLARLAGCAVLVCVLDDDDALRVVTSAGGLVARAPQLRTDDELATHTAAAQVLLAARPDRDPPAGYTRPEWKRIRDSLSQPAAVAVDHQDLLPGVYCVAAAIGLPASGEVAAIGAMFVNRVPPRDLSELVLRAAREAARSLAYQ